LVEVPARVRSTHGSHEERSRAAACGGDVSRQGHPSAVGRLGPSAGNRRDAVLEHLRQDDAGIVLYSDISHVPCSNGLATGCVRRREKNKCKEGGESSPEIGRAS